MSSRCDVWKQFTNNKSILYGVAHGIKIKFVNKLPARNSPVIYPPKNDLEYKIYRQEIRRIKALGAIQEVMPGEISFFSAFFLQPKKGSDKFRPLFDKRS